MSSPDQPLDQYVYNDFTNNSDNGPEGIEDTQHLVEPDDNRSNIKLTSVQRRECCKLTCLSMIGPLMGFFAVGLVLCGCILMIAAAVTQRPDLGIAAGIILGGIFTVAFISVVIGWVQRKTQEYINSHILNDGDSEVTSHDDNV